MEKQPSGVPGAVGHNDNAVGGARIASLVPSLLRYYDHKAQAASLGSYLRFSAQLGRRWSRVLLSTVLAIVLLLLPQTGIRGGASSSQLPVSRASVLNAVRHPQDAFRNYVKGENCTFSSLDLHQPFRPLCKDRASLLEAMSSGGRLGFEQPYMPLGCDMRWFSTAEICDILARFDNVLLAGDSQSRYLTEAFNVLLREDLVNGSLATWRFDLEDNPGCDCNRRFFSVECTWWIALNTIQVLEGDPASIKCPKNKRPASIQYTPVLAFPLQHDELDGLAAKFAPEGMPTGRDVLVLQHGLWNQMDVERTMAWVEQIEEALGNRNPALFDPTLDPRLFPRLMLSPTAQGANMPGKYLCLQNNIRLQAHINRIGPWSQERGYDYLGLYNLTAQTRSVDGVHAGFRVNLVKAMMILNWLNTLNPLPASGVRSPIPSEPIEALKPDTPYATLQRELAAAARLSRSQSSETESFTTTSMDSAATSISISNSTKTLPSAPHPIDTLIAQAQAKHKTLLDSVSHSIESAAEKYRKRRGRHPPPGFDKWVQFAQQKNSPLVEEFYDPIYDSIELSWGVPVSELREFCSSWYHVISIRNGTTTPFNFITVINDPMSVWQQALNRLPSAELPDVDLPFNPYDEPMLFVPWKTRQEHVERANASRSAVLGAHHVTVNTFPSYPQFSASMKRPAFEEFEDDMNLWEMANKACPLGSPAAQGTYSYDFTTPTSFSHGANTDFLQNGYVSNWASAKSACQDPTIANLHGSFVSPMRMRPFRASAGSWTLITQPVPMLAPCRIHDVTFEIPIPCSICLQAAGDDAYASGFSGEKNEISWEKKKSRFFWRGVASGGMNDADNWTRFQRHRFVAMLNATMVALHLGARSPKTPEHLPGGVPELPHNFALPPDVSLNQSVKPPPHPLSAMQGPKFYIDFPAWINRHTNVSFTHLRCWPMSSWFTNTTKPCPYTGPFYSVAKEVNASTNFQYKYLPDIDGASFSGRFWGFLSSGSMPLKSTIYDEWYDGRIIPWWDFVPLTVGISDLWGVMQWAVGFDPSDFTQEALGIEAWSWTVSYMKSGKQPGTEEQQVMKQSNTTYTEDMAIAGHDAAAATIAKQGREWSKQVLRRDDMDVYLYRVVLEIARVVADDREKMGFVDDLRKR